MRKKQSSDGKQNKSVSVVPADSSFSVDSRQFQEALDSAYIEAERNRLLDETLNIDKWSLEISSEDETLHVDYSDKEFMRSGIRSSDKPMEWVSKVAPEDRESVVRNFMAAINDHSGKTKFDATFHVKSSDGTWKLNRSVGRVIRKSDGSGEFFGLNINLTEQVENRIRAKMLEKELAESKLRADALAYIADNEPDLDKTFEFLGKRIIDTYGCDQVIFRGFDGHRVVINAPGINEVPREICSACPYFYPDDSIFEKNGIVMIDDCRRGFEGVPVHPECPVKSSVMHRVYFSGRNIGQITIQYIKEPHVFSDYAADTVKTLASYCGLLYGRINEKKAERARLEAESSSKAKSEFLFNMSHDIRTPMNAIMGYTDIALKHFGEEDRVRDSLDKIRISGDHLLNLINDILEMSRIEAGKIEIVNAPVNILVFTGNTETMCRSLADSKDISFTRTVGNMNNPFVFADELHINRIVINLISNAIKYTDSGGNVEYGISQVSEPADGTAVYRFSVKDNGTGMSEEFQKHLFESFARENTATVSKKEGAGLGLAIVKRITDLIGGRITVDSEKGKGSTFIVELPLRVMNENEIAEFSPSSGIADAGDGDSVLNGKRVLLVEDNDMNMEISTEMLKEFNLVVDSAEDGSAAVDMIASKGAGFYDFILMDIQMPVMNGYEATKMIRKLPGGENVPIIALSANAFREDIDRSLASGMNAHVAKPIDMKKLISIMHGLLKSV